MVSRIASFLLLVAQAYCFSWDADCTLNSTAAAVIIHNATISPTPVIIPGEVVAAYRAETTRRLFAPIRVEIELRREIKVELFGFTLFHKFVKVPCISDFGSCTYDDVCLESWMHCPLEKGIHRNDGFHVDLNSVPDFIAKITEGTYRSVTKIYDGLTNEELICFNAEVEVKHKEEED